jgi:hypothetical protein
MGCTAIFRWLTNQYIAKRAEQLVCRLPFSGRYQGRADALHWMRANCDSLDPEIIAEVI